MLIAQSEIQKCSKIPSSAQLHLLQSGESGTPKDISGLLYFKRGKFVLLNHFRTFKGMMRTCVEVQSSYYIFFVSQS